VLNACWACAEPQDSTHGLTQSVWHEGAQGDRPQHSTAQAVCLSGAVQALICAWLAERGTSNAAAITASCNNVRLIDNGDLPQSLSASPRR